MSTERFHIIYDGPALADHRMDVRDLAPALMAVGNLAKDANRLINGEKSDISVEVHASFKVGSFGIEMFFSQDMLTQIRDILSGPNVSALANLMALLGFSGAGGLIWLLKKLRGKKLGRIQEFPDGSAQVEVSESETIYLEDKRVLILFNDRNVRQSLEKVLSPLDRDGIVNFGVVYKDEVIQSVESEELWIFRWSADEDGEVVSDTVRERITLLIESVVFRDGNKWRVHDGQFGFHAAIEDAGFMSSVESGERFGKGDVLVADLRIVQSVSNGSLSSRYEIIRVHEHRDPLQKRLI